MSKLMRSISGIRGIVGDTLTPQVLQSHVRAFLEITKAKRVVIGRDSRPTGDAIVQYVAGICRLSGVDVMDVGLSTTPSVELLTTHFKADAGIIITASHNPLEWNALKFLNNKGLFLGPDDVKQLFALADANEFSYPDYRTMGKYEVAPDADGIHIDGTLKIPFVDVEAIKAKHFKVAVDAVNGAGSFIVTRLLNSSVAKLSAFIAARMARSRAVQNRFRKTSATCARLSRITVALSALPWTRMQTAALSSMVLDKVSAKNIRLPLQRTKFLPRRRVAFA